MASGITNKLKKLIPESKIVRFIIVFLLIFLPWYFIDDYMQMARYGPFFVNLWFFAYHLLLKSLMFLSVHLTTLFTDVPITTTYRVIDLGYYGSLSIGRPCLCADVMMLLLAFVVAYPGPWKKKLWFLPLGLASIHLMNVLRITALCLTKIYHPEWMHINHTYIFNMVILGFTFLLWVLWIAKVSPDNPKKTIAGNNKENQNTE